MTPAAIGGDLSNRLQLFVPEGDRESTSVPVDLQDRWAVHLLDRCGDLFGGATSYDRGIGVWRDERGRKHWDRVVVIEAWVDPSTPRLKAKLMSLWRGLESMRVELRQRVVGCLYNGRWTSYRERSS